MKLYGAKYLNQCFPCVFSFELIFIVSEIKFESFFRKITMHFDIMRILYIFNGLLKKNQCFIYIETFYVHRVRSPYKVHKKKSSIVFELSALHFFIIFFCEHKKPDLIYIYRLRLIQISNNSTKKRYTIAKLLSLSYKV